MSEGGKEGVRQGRSVCVCECVSGCVIKGRSE